MSPLNQYGCQSRDRPGSPWLNFPDMPLSFFSLSPLKQACPLFPLCPMAENANECLQFRMMPQGGSIKALRPQQPPLLLPHPGLWTLLRISSLFPLPAQLNVEMQCQCKDSRVFFPFDKSLFYSNFQHAALIKRLDNKHLYKMICMKATLPLLHCVIL